MKEGRNADIITTLIDYHKHFAEHNEDILEDVSNTLQKLDESKYAKKIRDHSKFLYVLRAIADYNRRIERLAEKLKEEITDVLLSYEFPENYELLLLVFSDYYRTFSNIAFAVKEIFWELSQEFNIKLARAKGEDREDIYHQLINDLKQLYEKMEKAASNIKRENEELIRKLQQNEIHVTKKTIEDLEKLLHIIKKMVYRSKILHKHIFRFMEEEDEFSRVVREAVRESLKNMI